MERCRVAYFDYPDANLRSEYGSRGASGLEEFNRNQNQKGPAGFSMIEEIVSEDGHMAPPIIFYAGVSARVVRSLCGEKITNRADVLLQSVVSVLEEQRWQLLPVRE